MNIEDGTMAQYDLEYITWYGTLYRMKTMNGITVHDFLTSVEGLVPCFSEKFLCKLKREFERGVEHSTINSREFQDTVDVINKELERRSS